MGGEQGEGVGRDMLIATVTAIKEVKLYLMNLQHMFANGERLESPLKTGGSERRLNTLRDDALTREPAGGPAEPGTGTAQGRTRRAPDGHAAGMQSGVSCSPSGACPVFSLRTQDLPARGKVGDAVRSPPSCPLRNSPTVAGADTRVPRRQVGGSGGDRTPRATPPSRGRARAPGPGCRLPPGNSKRVSVWS